ncbi:LGFP repeat-containing protein [Prauserella flavalba]|uniref:LGFP repeat-containing protein n=1 Tax=Prauserella flavalba TaxID=1477506 RepID=UPI000D774C4F|nr:hypothetical protein [Prauserella flavalba]
MHGTILSEYIRLGGTGSRLGLPVSDEFAVAEGHRSNFQHGALIWNATTGAVQVV